MARLSFELLDLVALIFEVNAAAEDFVMEDALADFQCYGVLTYLSPLGTLLLLS